MQGLYSGGSRGSSKDSTLHTIATAADHHAPHHHMGPPPSGLWDLHEIRTHVGNYCDSTGGSLGFEVCQDASVVCVTTVYRDGPFYSKLRPQDELVRVNGIDCSSEPDPVAAVFRAVRTGGPWTYLTVRRKRNSGVSGMHRGVLRTCHLHCPGYHGVTLLTGVYIAAIQPHTPADAEPSLATGDRIISINGKSIDGSGVNTKEAQQLLDAGVGDVVQLTTLKSICSSCSTSSTTHITDDLRATTASSSGYVTSPSVSERRGDTIKKFMRGADESHYDSSTIERSVYTVTKAHCGVDKGSTGGKWDQIKNIVRPPVHHSNDRPEDAGQRQSPDDEEASKKAALSQLDSVINSYHKSSGSGGAGCSNTTKRSKKKEKEKTGGTWPKYKGGVLSTWDPSNDETLIKVEASRKRPPLTVYTPADYQRPDIKNTYDVFHPTAAPKHVEEALLHARSSSPHTRGFAPYSKSVDVSENSQFNIECMYSGTANSNYNKQQQQQPPQSAYCSSRRGVEEGKREDNERETRLGSLTPSDTSLDFSVRSGNVGKEELEYYVKKNIVKCPLSDSESNVSPVDHNASPQPSSLPVTYGYRPYNMRLLSEALPSKAPINPHTGLYSPPNVGGPRSSPAFTPYSPFTPYAVPHQHTHPHTTVPSLPTANSPSSYSTPPTAVSSLMSPSPYLHLLQSSRSGDSLLSSPGQDRDPQDVTGHYERRLSPSIALNNRASSAAAASNTAMYYHYQQQLASTPFLEFADVRARKQPQLRSCAEELPPSTRPPSYHDYQRTVTTMPRKRDEEKIRLSSTLGGLIKTSSTDRSGDTLDQYRHSSPPPPALMRSNHPANQLPLQIYYTVHNRQFANYHYYHRKPEPGEIRNIVLEKDSEPLGIQIRCLKSGGVFVSAVTVNSLAEQVGIIVGDQLLEVCGINMRSAKKNTASTVLSQCGKSVTILVQNNLDKYEEMEDWQGSCSGSSLIEGGTSRSGTPTPRNTPPPSGEHDTVKRARRCSEVSGEHGRHPASREVEDEDDEEDEEMSCSGTSTLRAPHMGGDVSLSPSARSTLTRPQVAHVLSTLNRQDTFKRTKDDECNSSDQKQQLAELRSRGSRRTGRSSSERRKSSASVMEEPRTVYLEVNKGSMGVRLVGGNALGVFIHVVIQDSPASKAALRPGDRILEYNGNDLRHATAEQASYELAKPADNVSMLVQYDPRTYTIAMEQPGDSFFVRALFDNPGCESTQQLGFRKDDILYVDNTLYNSVPGQWRAWRVDQDGQKRNWGTIPSKDKVEEALLQRGGSGIDLSTLPFAGGTVLSALSSGSANDSSRRGSTTARRSFFRRKKHSRSSSRDSKELASFSDASLNSYSDGAAGVHEDTSLPLAYLRVERMTYAVRRPVLLIGPLWEFVADKLCHDYPHEYVRCIPEVNMRASGEQLETATQGGLVVEFRKRGHSWDVTTVQQLKDVAERGSHGIMDVSISAVERLHRLNIYPIVLILKFRSIKQVREMCDTLDKTMPQKSSQKEAKERFEMCSKMEAEYKSLVSAVVPAVVNMAYMCTQVKACVDSEQSKTLWVPTS